MSKVAAESLVGSTLGDKYAIEAFIGEGAMGSVYRAHQTSLHKTVAIKVLHRHLAEQPTFVERFQREAFSASLLDHPNSLRVLDFGQSNGLLYLVMEFVQGDDLLTVMQREWPFDNQRIVNIMSQALAALATAHDLGLVHRDLKPENILLLRGTDDEGRPTDVVKVCDFGIAKLSARSERTPSFARHLTTEGFVIGTPDYMSPEQARGDELDGRSDLYSLGVVLYHVLVGRLPFQAETPLGVVLRHISDPPPPPSSHTKVHAHLEHICMRALAKDPNDRFQNARDMRRALRAALSGSDESSRNPVARSTDMTSVPASSPTLKAPSASRFWGLAGLGSGRRRWAALVATAAGFGGALLLMRYVSTNVGAGAAVVTTPDEAILTNPSPPIAASALAPLVGAPAAAGLEPERTSAPPSERPTSRAADRATAALDRHPAEKSGGHTAANGSPAAAPAAAKAQSGESTIASARATLAQPSSVPSAETTAGPSTTSENVRPAPSEPEARPAAPPPSTAKTVPTADTIAPPPDPSRASVAVGAVTTTGGISASKVKVALARIPFTPCYRKALSGRSTAAPMETTLRINIDVGGRVAGTVLSSDGNLPGLRSCIESEVRSLSIRDVDTGDGSAVVTLTFSPR